MEQLFIHMNILTGQLPLDRTSLCTGIPYSFVRVGGLCIEEMLALALGGEVCVYRDPLLSVQ